MIIEEEFHGADFGAGYALLEALQEEGVITEARASIISNQIIISEAVTKSSPTQYVHKGRIITWEQFKAVYTDYDRYQTTAEVWLGLGYPEELFKPASQDAKQTTRDNMAKSLERVIEHFKRYNKEGNEILVSPKYRMTRYSKIIPDNRSRPEPTMADIHGGSVTRRTNASAMMDRINQQKIMAGEFYSNTTRIPKSHWGNWLRFWEREYSSVHNDHSMFGRVWKKDFVLGYQMEDKLFYEIWYNSIDSTFALHDSNGNQISRRVATLNEAMRALMNAVKQASPQDADFFRGNMNNQLAASLIRSITPGLDKHIEDLKKLDSEYEKNKEREEEEREAARKAAAEKRRENIEYFRKQAMDVAVSYGKEKAAEILAQARAEAERAKAEERSQRARANQAAADDIAQANRRHDATHDAVRASMERAKRAAQARAQSEYQASPEANKGRWEAEAMMRAKEFARQELERRKRKLDAERKRRARAAKKDGIPALPAPKDLTEQVEYWSPKIEGDSEGGIDIPTNYGRDIEQMRRIAAHGSETQDAIKRTVNSEMIQTYQTSRVEDSGFIKNRFLRWINKGRGDSIVLPNDMFIWKQIKSYVLGQRYRADFVIGFTLNDAVNIEIWYVSEPNPAKGSGFHGSSKTISSFYIFDVKSGKLLRKFVPYYRNAVQIAMAKLSTI